MSTIAITATPSFNWATMLVPARQREVEDNLRQIIQNNHFSPENTATLQSAIRISNQWSPWSRRVASLLRELDQKVIFDFLNEIAKAPPGREVNFFIEKSLAFLTEQGLLDLTGLETPQNAELLHQARAAVRPSINQLTTVRNAMKLVLEFWVELKYFIHHIIDLFIAATGLNALVRSKHQRWESSSVPTNEYAAINQMNTYKNLLYSPAVIFGLIYAYVAIKTAAIAATAAAVIGIAALSIGYQRYLKPCPIDHDGLKNLSIEMLRKQDPNYPRQDILDQIQAAFQAKKGVLLVGPPGVGKTWIAQSLAQQLNEGKLCPFIKDPHVFSCNASGLKSFSDMSLLQGLENRFERHASNVVFFFDEFHAIFEENEAFKAGTSDQIKTFCETFKYVIGATTQSEFDQHVKGKVAIIDRRFVMIQVAPLPVDKIAIALSQHMEALHPELECEDNILDEIARNASLYNPNTSPVDAAHSLLSVAVNLMTTIQYTELERKITDLNDQIGVIARQIKNCAFSASQQLTALTGKLDELKTQLRDAQETLSAQKEKSSRLRAMEQELLRLKKQSNDLANPNGTYGREWLTVNAKIAVMSRAVKALRAELKLPFCLGKELIDSIIEQKRAAGASSSSAV